MHIILLGKRTELQKDEQDVDKLSQLSPGELVPQQSPTGTTVPSWVQCSPFSVQVASFLNFFYLEKPGLCLRVLEEGEKYY